MNREDRKDLKGFYFFEVFAVFAVYAQLALQLAAALISCEERPEELGFICLDDRLSDAARREGFAVLPRGSHDKLFSDTRIK